jgi:hypothetical protein
MSKKIILLPFLVFMASAASSEGVFFDLERDELIEGHWAETLNGTLTNDVNELPLGGQDLFVSSTFDPSFAMTISSGGSDLFVNTILEGDTVEFGIEGISTPFDIETVVFQVGENGLFSAIAPVLVNYYDPDGLAEYIFSFDAQAFIGADTFTVNADLSPVPVPAAAWLFGSALLGLAGVKRKK